MGNRADLAGRANIALYWIAAAVVGVVAILIAVNVWRADAAPGDFDTTYTPIAGCRVTDTRGPANIGPRSNPLGEDETFEIQIHGENGQCQGDLAIPTAATGIAANVTATGATTSSNVRIFPAGLDEVPLLSNLNVTAGSPPTPNAVIVQLSPDGKIEVYNFRGSVDIVVDIVGWFGPQSLAELAASANGPAGPQGPAGPPGPAGVVVMGHGWGPEQPGDSAELRSFSNTQRLVSPVGNLVNAQKQIDGPVSIAGAVYALTSIEYCIVGYSSDAWLTIVEARAATGSQFGERLAIDTTFRNTPGCYTLQIDDAEAHSGVLLTFGMQGDSPNEAFIDFGGITGTWTPLG